MKPIIWVCWILVILSAVDAFAEARLARIVRAQFLISTNPRPPGASARWEEVSLPAAMPSQRLKAGTFIWYRCNVEIGAVPSELWALYIPHQVMNIDAYVNETLIGSSNNHRSNEINSNYPQYYIVPASALRAGENVIHLRLSPSSGGDNHLSVVSLGPADDLFIPYQRRFILQVIGPLLVTAVNAFMCIFMLALWLRQPKETAFGWFGLACLFWVVRNAHFFVRAPPMPHAYWYALSHASIGWVEWTLFMFAFRLAEQSYPRCEKILFFYALTGSIVLFATVGTPYYFRIRDLNFFGVVPLAVPLIGFLCWAAWRTCRRMTMALALACCLFFMFGAYDLYGLIYATAGDGAHIYILPYGILVLTVVASAAVIHRIASSRETIAGFNRQLKARIAQREDELGRIHIKNSAAEKSAAIASERQRIVRNIHDDLGSQLMSSVPLVERGELSSAELATLLKECIDGLRLAIDSLKPLGNDLNAVLGNFRYRFESRLQAAGLVMEWAVEELPRDLQISPETVLQIMRIVQETMTNAMKHSGADRVRVFARYDAIWSTLELAVVDNGKGFVIAGKSAGEGIDSMRQRAMRLGAELNLNSSPQGTQVVLRLPLPRTPVAAGQRTFM